MELSKKDLISIALGASLRATGGGIARSEQEQRLLAINDQVHLVGIDSVQGDGFICTTYDLAASSGEGASRHAVITAIQCLEKFLSQKCVGIFPGETGVECLAFEAARALNVPVIDADSTGGRAVPCMAIDNFVLHEISTLPVSYATNSVQGIIKEAQSLDAVEQQLRQLSINNEAIAVADHSINPRKASGVLTLGAVSTSLKAGQALQRYREHGSQEELLHSISGRVIASGGISKVTQISDAPYYRRMIELNDKEHTNITIFNEILGLTNNSTSIFAPRLLCAIDVHSRLPLHVKEMALGMEILLIELPCEERWKRPMAAEMFSRLL